MRSLIATLSDLSLATLGETSADSEQSLESAFRGASKAWAGFLNVSIDTFGNLKNWDNHALEIEQVVNEALANSHRHGRATQVVISIRAQDSLVLEIEDNGIGFTSLKPGLGSEVFQLISGGNFKLENSETGVKMTLTIA